MPPTISAIAATTASTVGTRKFRFRLSSDVCRHASKGPTPVRNTRNSPIGTFTRLKKGGPTVTLLPVTHSDSTANSVPQSTAKHDTSSTRLLNRKPDSRETSESSRCSLRSVSRLRTNTYTQVAKQNAINHTNQMPMPDCANACTELTTPERVRNVPKIANRNVMKMSHMFHIFIMPRFSCIITECRNAVIVSQGSREAFSTGSHPQYPPQPSTSYAQCAPRKMPQVRNSHATMVQRRVMWIHFSPGYFIISAPSAKANGAVTPT